MAKEAKAQQEPEGSEALPKKKGKFRLTVLLVLLIIVAAAGAGFYFFSDKLGFLGIGNLTPKKAASSAKAKSIGPILALEPFLFNTAGAAQKYAKISVGIEVKDEKSLEKVKKATPALRDRILATLAPLDQVALMDVKQHEKMKKDLGIVLNQLFGQEDIVRNIYIMDIIIQ
jgi:flagellar basal body-associated protein FliL